MLPIVVLTAEEAIKAVPRITRDAAYGMGCTRTQVAWKVLLPTALPGILTGVMLAVGPAAGGAAPPVVTAPVRRLRPFRGGLPPGMSTAPSPAGLRYNLVSDPVAHAI